MTDATDFATPPPAGCSSSASGCPNPRRCAATRPGEPLVDRPGAARRGAAAGSPTPVGQRRSSARRASSSATRSTPPTATTTRVRRALVFDATGHHRPTGCARSTSSSTPCARSRCPSGRVVVLGTPPEQCRGAARGDRPARARGLRPLGRQGVRPRRHRAAGLRRARAPRPTLESTLRFLLSGRSAYVSGQVIRIGAGTADRRRPTGSGRWPARSRWSPAPRGASARRSPGCSPATARTSSASTSRPPGEELAAVANEIGGDGAAARHHRRGRARRGSPTTSPSATAASTSSSTTPASPATRRSAA